MAKENTNLTCTHEKSFSNNHYTMCHVPFVLFGLLNSSKVLPIPFYQHQVSESISSQEYSPHFHQSPQYKVTIHLDWDFPLKPEKKPWITINSGPSLEDDQELVCVVLCPQRAVWRGNSTLVTAGWEGCWGGWYGKVAMVTELRPSFWKDFTETYVYREKKGRRLLLFRQDHMLYVS